EIDGDGKPRFQGFPGGGGGPGGFSRNERDGFETFTFRAAGAGPQGGFGGGGAFDDILSSMFGGAGRGRGGAETFEYEPGHSAMPELDLNASLGVTLEEAVHGAEKRVRLPTGKELN